MAKVIFFEDDPGTIAALAVKVSQTPLEEGDLQTLFEQCRQNKEESIKLVNRVLKSQHLIFGDFLPYAIGLENLSRFAAIYFWRNVNIFNLVFGAGIEASFRVIRPNRFTDVLGDFGQKAFTAYEKAVQAGVLEQDARYILPEGALTRMVFSAPVRYLLKLARFLKKSELQELREIGTEVERIVSLRFGIEIIEEKIPTYWPFWANEINSLQPIFQSEKTFIDYRGKIPSLSLTMGIEGSLAMYAQLVRQRQILCDIEPLEMIAKGATFVLPKAFPEEVKNDYRQIAEMAHHEQLKRIAVKDPSFVYFLLLGQNAGATIYGKGAGVIETAKSRSEGVAQWEIRNVVGISLVEKLAKYEELRQEIGPRCWREKRCIEPAQFKMKKAVCPSFMKWAGNWNGTLEELMDTLKEPSQKFTL